MRVLIAYDGSAHADAALQDLHRAGLHDVETRVLSVTEVWLPPPEMLPASLSERGHQMLAEHRESALAAARHSADRAAVWLREQFPHWRVDSDGAAGSPLEAIIAIAESWQAELVIVGAHGRATAAHMWPGSVSLGVLRHVPRSARVVRCSAHEPHSANRLILAVDGSDHAQRMLEHVRSRCWAPDTQLRVTTIIDSRLMPLVLPGFALGPTSEDWAHEIADRATFFLREGGLSAVASVERGDPKQVILNAAHTWPADCIFVGARGLTRLPLLPLGSISTALALRAPCTVEVVRQPVLTPKVH